MVALANLITEVESHTAGLVALKGLRPEDIPRVHELILESETNLPKNIADVGGWVAESNQNIVNKRKRLDAQ